MPGIHDVAPEPRPTPAPVRQPRLSLPSVPVTGPPTVANLLVLQRLAGNAAVQRYVPDDRKEALDEATYDQRAQVAERNSDGFDVPNRGWIRLADAGDQESIHHARSSYQTGHAEEKLLETARSKPRMNLATPADAVGRPRVLELYSERKPCSAANADASRKGRAFENCEQMLTELLHPATKVSFSVPNIPYDHSKLVDKARLRYIAEVLACTRQGSAKYNKLIRQEHFDRFGTYGRDYVREQEAWDQMVTAVKKLWAAHTGAAPQQFYQEDLYRDLLARRAAIVSSVKPGKTASSDPILEEILWQQVETVSAIKLLPSRVGPAVATADQPGSPDVAAGSADRPAAPPPDMTNEEPETPSEDRAGLKRKAPVSPVRGRGKEPPRDDGPAPPQSKRPRPDPFARTGTRPDEGSPEAGWAKPAIRGSDEVSTATPEPAANAPEEEEHSGAGPEGTGSTANSHDEEEEEDRDGWDNTLIVPSYGDPSKVGKPG